MKKIISICIGFILFLWLVMFMASCTPVRYVNVHSHRNYYNKHRATTYTAPVWVPGKGVVLQTQPVPLKYRKTRRGKH